MLVRCEKCGYENFPQHRFCGMCGAGLRLPQPPAAVQPVSTQAAPPPKPAAAAQPSAPKSLTGPSFLGLADEPAQHSDVSYLLEDEPSSSHRGRYVVLIILIAAVAASAWYWRQDLRAWAGKIAGNPSAGSTETANSSASSAAPVTPAAPSAAATSANDKPATGTGDQPASSPSQVPAAAAAAAPEPAASSGAGPPSAVSEAAQPQQPAPAQQSAPPKQQNNSSSGQSASDEKSPAAAVPAESSVTKSPAPAKPPKAAVEPASPAAESDALEAQGEKYLYGNGVPTNCARAQKSLLAAAARSNAKAQSVLGTMYATGHCATRDLPAAYRWFARALRQDPSNSRYEQDLKVLWGQMTPEERQQALQNGR